MDSFVDFVRSNSGLLAGILGLLLWFVTSRDRSRSRDAAPGHNNDLTPEALYGEKIADSYSHRRARFYFKASIWLGILLVSVYGVTYVLNAELLDNWLFQAIIFVLGPMVVIYLLVTALRERWVGDN